MKTIAIIGTSLAGLRTAQELRARGYDGRLVLVGDEPHRPYDRPPLSKGFLLGEVDVADLELATGDELLDLEAQWYLGTRAERLSPSDGAVTLSDGTEIVADGVVVATGATPKTLPGQPEAHTLRTLDDAVALRRALSGGGARVLVVGAGFIGAEVASTARELGNDVTVVEALPIPLAGVLGDLMGAAISALHERNGVHLRTGTTELPSGVEVVVAGIGVRPNTDWLTGSGIAVDDGVLCDSGGVTGNPRVVAVGDVARYRRGGRRVRAEHWTAATEQAGVAAANLLAGSTVARYRRPGYFWSEQYGHRIQFAGESADEVRVVEGSPSDGPFVATYHRNGVMTGVLAVDRPRPFTRLRRSLAAPVAVG